MLAVDLGIKLLVNISSLLLLFEKSEKPLQGAVIMQATTADLAFAAVCDLEIHKSDNCKPKHIMLVINCSKIM